MEDSSKQSKWNSRLFDSHLWMLIHVWYRVENSSTSKLLHIYVLCSTPFVNVCTIFDNKLVYIWILMLKKMINSHISRYELNISLIANLADMSRHGHFLIVFFSKHRFKKYRTQRVTSWYGIRLEQDLICRRAEPCWQTEKKPLEQKRRISCTAAHNSVTTL